MDQARAVEQAIHRARALAQARAGEDAVAVLRAAADRFPANRRLQVELKAIGAALPSELARSLIALLADGREAEAWAAARAAAASHPVAALPNTVLGVLLLGRDRPAEALPFLGRAARLDPGHAETANNLGTALLALGRVQEAEAAFEQALARQHDYPEALLNHGLAALRLGRGGDAAERFRRAIARRPLYPEACRHLAETDPPAVADPLVADLQAAADDQARPANARAQWHFALGRVFDGAGDCDRAFAHFSAGNALRRIELAYDPARDRQLFARIGELEDALAAGRSMPPKAPDPSAARPVFVLGMPRSGTSLVEQILASHSAVTGAGELDLMSRAIAPVLGKALAAPAGTPFAPVDLAAIADSYREGLAPLAGGRPVAVDKMPGNARWAGVIARALPDARIIHVRREPRAIAWSVFTQYFPARGLGFAWDLRDIAAYQHLLDGLMAELADRHRDRVLVLDYERLVDDQEAETRRLLLWCGLDFEPACLHFHRTERPVATASALQVRKPLYRGSGAAWRRYAGHIERALAP